MVNRVKPILVINKIDRLFLEKQLDGEESYHVLRRIVEEVNAVIATHADEEMGDCEVSPTTGTVVFAAGQQGWAFTIDDFVKLYCKFNRTPVTEANVTRWLWGDHFYDPTTTIWSRRPSKSSFRGFAEFVYRPISQLLAAVQSGDQKEVAKKLKMVEIKVKPEVLEATGKELLRRVMQAFLPAGDALLKSIVTNLPSPAVAQPYRVDFLYNGPRDDKYSLAMKACDKDGPVMVYIAKLHPAADHAGKFFALGRVFSGNVAAGAKVRVISADDDGKEHTTVKAVHRAGLWMLKAFEAVDGGVPCGNAVALYGLDGVITKTATVAGEKDVKAHSFKPLKHPAAALVRVSVSCGDVKKLRKALESLAKADPLAQYVYNHATGEHLLAAVGDLHLQTCINDLKKSMSGADLVVGAPVVQYRETVVAKSTETVMARSANKHNRLCMLASPLDEALVQAIDNKLVGPCDAETLHLQYGLENADSKKVWCFGPMNIGPNMMVNQCRAVLYTKEAREAVVTGFQEASQGGVLAGEPLHGVRVDLTDAVFHSDAAHRGAGQIAPPTVRAIHAAQLAASPRLMEPVYKVEIKVPEEHVGGVYKLLNSKRGAQVVEQSSGSVTALLPVAESFGFVEAIRMCTSGMASPYMEFQGWEVMGSDPLDPTSPAAAVVAKIRDRKNLGKVPTVNELLEK